MSEAQSDMPDMTNTQEIDSHSQGLPMILMDVVTQSIKEFRSMCQAKAKTLIVPPRAEQKKNGKRMKNPVVAEEKVSFCLPENCGTGIFKDMEKVMAKLGDWKLQSRIRDTRMRDTYYYHTSSTQTFRSITEVVNYILPDTYPKFPSRKRSRKGQHDEVETPEKSKKKPSASENSENAEDKEENLELQNISPETLQVAPDVAASVEQEPEAHDEGIIDIEEDHFNVEQELETHDEAVIVGEDRPHSEQELQTYHKAIIGVEKDRPHVEQEPQTHDEAIIGVEEDHSHLEAINEPMYIGANEDRPQHEDLVDIHLFIGLNEDCPQHENFEDIGMYNGANEDRPQHEDLEDISQDFGAYDNVLDTYYDRC